MPEAPCSQAGAQSQGQGSLTKAPAAQAGMGSRRRLGGVRVQDLLHQLLYRELLCPVPTAPLDAMNWKTVVGRGGVLGNPSTRDFRPAASQLTNVLQPFSVTARPQDMPESSLPPGSTPGSREPLTPRCWVQSPSAPKGPPTPPWEPLTHGLQLPQQLLPGPLQPLSPVTTDGTEDGAAALPAVLQGRDVQVVHKHDVRVLENRGTHRAWWGPCSLPRQVPPPPGPAPSILQYSPPFPKLLLPLRTQWPSVHLPAPRPPHLQQPVAAPMECGDDGRVNVAAIETLPGDRLGWGEGPSAPRLLLCSVPLQEAPSFHQRLFHPRHPHLHATHTLPILALSRG